MANLTIIKEGDSIKYTNGATGEKHPPLYKKPDTIPKIIRISNFEEGREGHIKT